MDRSEWIEKYHALREKEGWVLSDEEVTRLPDRPKNDPLYHHWMMRKDSMKRILRLIQDRGAGPRIGDLGCGNGWLGHWIAGLDRVVVGVDPNLPDIQQAQRVFSKTNLEYRLGDETELVGGKPLDLVLISAALQYFAHPRHLFSMLLDSMPPHGEVWIADTFLYTEKEAGAARERSMIYYERSGSPELKDVYHHHTWKIFEGFDTEVLYQPNLSRLARWLVPHRSPFPIIAVKKR